jgi:transmembrane sensor
MERKMKHNIDHNVLIKILSGSANNSDLEKFNKWLGESERNKTEFEELKKVWQMTEPKQIQVLPDVKEEWNGLISEINNTKRIPQKNNKLFEAIKSIDQFIFASKLRPVFATIITLLFISLYFFIINKESIIPVVEYQSITTSKLDKTEINLPDGSKVFLNGGSKIIYPDKFIEDNREIRLTGEAFFSVVKDKRPFIITTDNARIKVLGTKFDVWSRENKTRVVVQEGLVNVAQKRKFGNPVLLKKNQLTCVSNGSEPTKPKEVDSKEFLSWMENTLLFNQTSFGEVVKELERFYDIKISVKDERIKNYSLTGKFKRENIESTLSMICLAMDLDYSKQQDGFIIKQKMNVNQLTK